jgi:Malectin domain
VRALVFGESNDRTHSADIVSFADILGTTDDEVYNFNRWGQFSYNIPVPAGTYEIVLHLSETL